MVTCACHVWSLGTSGHTRRRFHTSQGGRIVKMRHIRVLAVLGIVLVTLTGARGSRGGCDSDSGSGGSGTSGGGQYDDDGHGSASGGGSAPGGESATDGPETGPVDAMAHVEFKFCSLDPTATNLRGHLYISNAATTDQTYDVTVQFAGDSPTAAPVVRTIDDVTVAAFGNHTMDVEAPYTGSGKGADTRDCKVVSATRTAS